MGEEKKTEIVSVAERGIVTPAAADEVLKVMEAFDYFKTKVLKERDFATIQGKPYVKKSGWSKYALACNVSTEIKEERIEERTGKRIYHFIYRAIHLPSGRYAEAVGSASEAEKEDWNHPEHDVRALAQTRAFNRAISNLVGGGEISAEELTAADEEPIKRPTGRLLSIEDVKKVLVEAGIEESLVDENFSIKLLSDDSLVVEKKKEWLDTKIWDKVNSTLRRLGGKWYPEEGGWVVRRR